MAERKRSAYNDEWVSDWISEETRASFAARPAGPAGVSAFEKLVSGHKRANRRRPKGSFSIHIARQREIEKIVTSRYGKIVPETDDADVFIRAAAFAINAHCNKVDADFDVTLGGWCSRFAPWSLPRAGSIIRPIINELVGRRHDMRADDVANLLQVTFAERERLGLFTIGACDIPAQLRKRIVKARKRKRDRVRQAAIREAEGRQNRASYEAGSLSNLKPWVADGISRRTWERRRVAGLSRVEIYAIGDTLASTGVILALPSKSLPSLQSRIGADNADGGAEQFDVEDKCQAMGGAS